MADWEQPHWSGRPQAEPARARLRPNAFARIARACARRAPLVAFGFAVLCVFAAVYASATLQLNPQQAATVALDAQTEAAEQALDARFPGIDDAVVGIFTAADPATARDAAQAVAAALRRHGDIFASVDVPGTSDFDRRYGLLYLDAGSLQQRVRRAEALQPLLHALQAAPNFDGLAVMAQQVEKALAQGGSPQGIAPVLAAAADTVAGVASGAPRPLDWIRLAGLSADGINSQWYVIATPKPGQGEAAARLARASPSAGVEVKWNLKPGAIPPDDAHFAVQLAVPVALSILVGAIVLAVGLGRGPPLLAVAAALGATLALTAGAQSLFDPQLDTVEWGFAGGVLAPAVLLSTVQALAYERARAAGLDPRTAIMLAVHKQGYLVCGLAALTISFWAAWLPRAIPSLAHVAGTAIFASLLAVLIVFTLLPAVLVLADRRSSRVTPHWMDVLAEMPLEPNTANALNVSALLLIAFAAFSAVFVAGLRFADREGASAPGAAPAAVHLLAKDEQGARQLAAQLMRFPSVGSVRWLSWFLPENMEEKLSVLAELEAYSPPPAGADGPSQAGSLAELIGSLHRISKDPGAAADLAQSAGQFGRALAALPPALAGRAENAIFARLSDVDAEAERLSHLAMPRPADLDPALVRRFVAGDGTWRVEVLPRGGVGRLTFAAEMRKVSPAAAGRPIVDLARNEIMHHEAALAMAAALAAAAVVALALLRNLVDWFVALLALALFAGLCAAAVVLSGSPADPAVIGAAMIAFGLCLAASVLHLMRLREGRSGDGLPATGPLYRSGFLPPVVMTAVLAPLAVSGNTEVAHYGVLAGLFQALAVLVSILVVPQIGSWAGSLARG